MIAGTLDAVLRNLEVLGEAGLSRSCGDPGAHCRFLGGELLGLRDCSGPLPTLACEDDTILARIVSESLASPVAATVGRRWLRLSL